MANTFTKGNGVLLSTTKVAALLELLVRIEVLDKEQAITSGVNYFTIDWGSSEDNLVTFSTTNLPYTIVKDGETNKVVPSNIFDGTTASNGVYDSTGSELISDDYASAFHELVYSILLEELGKTPAITRTQINYGSSRNKVMTISGTINYTVSVNASGQPVKTAVDYLA